MPEQPSPAARPLDREAVAVILIDVQHTLVDVLFEPDRVNAQLLRDVPRAR